MERSSDQSWIIARKTLNQPRFKGGSIKILGSTHIDIDSNKDSDADTGHGVCEKNEDTDTARTHNNINISIHSSIINIIILLRYP